ncbi:hypothetical protein FOL47_007141 [Perkinsus chesapeaki]|uniref:Uncharacterized protein n=1 Tax=Perkinsus chesapeaki TaxID=330153 RepID=A0A7J6LMI8_PERCH|nr:hypothetical protein FOL47_007141 [Perkinsus chesapeaki]
MIILVILQIVLGAEPEERPVAKPPRRVLNKQTIKEASLIPNPTPTLNPSKFPMYSDEIAIDSEKRYIKAPKGGADKLSTWYHGIPTNLTINAPTEGRDGNVTGYNVWAYGFKAEFKPVQDGDHYLLSLVYLKCPVIDGKGRFSESSVKVTRPRKPITNFHLAFPLWEGAANSNEYQIWIRKPDPTNMRRRGHLSRSNKAYDKWTVKDGIKMLFYGLAGVAVSDKKIRSMPAQVSTNIPSDANLWFIRKLCEKENVAFLRLSQMSLQPCSGSSGL